MALSPNAQTSGSYKSGSIDGTVVLTGYSGKETEVFIPPAFHGNHVTKIGPSVFKERRDITKITLPQGLLEIETKALWGTGITEITLPESLNVIGDYAFELCMSLKTISAPDTNQAFTTKDGVLYSKDMSKLVAYPAGRAGKRFVIPSSVKTIAKKAFYFCSLTEIILPEGMERIDDEAFRGCLSLAQIDLPQSVTHIGNGAFESCDALESVILPKGVTQIGDRAFASCNVLRNVTLPEGVTVIGKEAFFDSSLVAIDLPGSLTEIGESALGSCDNLTNILIPKSVKTIGYKALNSCGRMQSIQVEADNDTYSSLDGVLYNKARTTLITCPIGKEGNRFEIPESVSRIEDYALENCFFDDIVIPQGVTHIGKYAFNDNCMITRFSIPASVISIGERALSDCGELQSISVSPDNPAYTCVGGVLYDKAMTELIVYPAQKANETFFSVPATVKRLSISAFMSNQTLQNITLPQGLESIGMNALSNCTGLRRLTIPNSATNINSSAFSQCKSLTSIALPDGLTVLPDYIFFDCSSLKTVSIPQSVTSIGKEAFYACKSLESIILPNDVTSIGDYAFMHCRKLTSIFIPAGVTFIGKQVFDDCPLLTISGVPGSAAQTYAQENGIPFLAM